MNDRATVPDAMSNRRRFRVFREWRLFAIAAVVALVLLIVIRAFFVDVYLIPSGSMESTLEPGDRILVNKLDKSVERGDIVVFDGSGSFTPYQSSSPWITDPLGTLGVWTGFKDSETTYIKRVIGVAGDTVECCSASGKLKVNGQEIDEPYIMDGDAASTDKFSVVVPEGRMWVMGDHRSASRDSRALLGVPGGGMIRTDKVIGHPFYIAFPLSRSGTL